MARAGAAESDKRIADGSARALEGIPLGIKDLFCTKGVLTTAGSHILDGFKPPYESTVTRNLWNAGAVMLGKLNMDEFAMGSSNETSYYKPVINPWRRKGSNTPLVPGGSSGGSAASVAARLVTGCDGHRYGRVDPPARGRDRHRGHQADLWALFALGHRRLRVVARSGGADGAHGARLRDHAEDDGEPRSAGFDQRRYAGAGLRSGDDGRISRACASAFRRSIASTGCRRRSKRCGPRASSG